MPKKSDSVQKIQSASAESITAQTINPTVIPEEEMNEFAKYGVKINQLIRKGKYGAVYEGEFDKDFDANGFTEKLKANKCIAKAIPEKGKKFAVKFVDIPLREQLGIKDVREAVINETNALTTACFDGIIDVYFIISMNEKKHYYFILEHAHQNLQTYIKRQKHKNIEEMMAKSWIKCLAVSLKYLHENGITHGEIKSSNILLFPVGNPNENVFKVKLADFVNSHILNPEKLKNTKDVETMVAEDRMGEDLMDMYFVFTEILGITKFGNESNRQKSHELMRQLITSDGDSRMTLNSILTQGNWLEFQQ